MSLGRPERSYLGALIVRAALIVAVLLASAAWADPSSTPTKKQVPPIARQTEAGDDKDKQANAKKEVTVLLPSTVNVSVSGKLDVVAQGEKPRASEEASKWADPVTWFTLVLAIANILLWWTTRNLVDEARKASVIAERALVAGQRAFVFAKGISGYWDKDDTTGQYSWRFRPFWENSGSSPTKSMTMYTRCMLLDHVLPPGFDFERNTTKNIGTGLIPPKTILEGGLSPLAPEPAISPQDLVDVKVGKKYLYLWGWARYNDVFPKTDQHITRFCWLVVIDGDPLIYDPNAKPPEHGSLRFSNIHHEEGNCADDECKHN